MLVARQSARLEQVAQELRAGHGVEVEALGADLSSDRARAQVVKRIADDERPVDLLINNAGFASPDGVLFSDYSHEDAALEVMVRAVLQLSHAALKTMAARGHGGIINVSSVAGFVPRGTYSAAKAYVTNFTESLAEEARGTGVRVVVDLPGLHPHRVPRPRAGSTPIPSRTSSGSAPTRSSTMRWRRCAVAVWSPCPACSGR